LAHEPPFPPVSGARIRTYHLLRELRHRGWSLAAFALTAAGDDDTTSADGLRELCDDVLLHRLPGGAARYRRLLTALSRREAFQARYFHDSSAAAHLHGSGLLDGADVIVSSLLYMHPYVPAALHERTAFDTHNSE